ncbi:sigma-70 family RNA polymerase sigma factor [Iamia sp.]|uniref:sigma-70 family RNA polymerase sigma factor n=1 Tax=Iamia sp. TaxID=2722710 RepID=UPI002CA113C3|nr:sigma-70 family RNA polymerase sigma factor [Iamia sp.]HXH59648.1 sigma-70 family RNA polymerase sigma factor [Iamia sp.]
MTDAMTHPTTLAPPADAVGSRLETTLHDAGAAVATSRQLHADSRARRRRVRHSLAEVTDSVDVLRARRTVPRGADARDWSSRPGVPLELWLLHVRFGRSGDLQHLRALVEEYDQYALSLARRLRRDREPSEDLDQVARESLVVALKRFDCERGLPFPAFATPTILGALRRHYRDHGWSIRVPRRVHELTVPAREAADRLTMALGRVPRTEEIADELGVTAEELRQVGEAAAARNPSSLDATPSPDASSPHEVVGAIDRNLLVTEDQVDLRQAIEHLEGRDRDILRLYFFDELTQSEIARRYGVSQMQVSRWIASILKRLRARMDV